MHTILTEAAGKEGRVRGRDTARAAFTLIELMVVMAIIIVLAGLSIRFMSGSTETANRRKAETQLSAMELALDMYKNEYGEYPISETEAEGAKVLYRALSGDEDSNGKVDPGKKPIMKELNPQADAQGMIANDGGSWLVVDPWGNPWQYLRMADQASRRTGQRNAATFDLWSEGGEAQGSSPETNTAKWIKNW